MAGFLKNVFTEQTPHPIGMISYSTGRKSRGKVNDKNKFRRNDTKYNS